MNTDGTLKEVPFNGKPLHGKEMFDAIDKACRQGYALRDKDNKNKAKIRGLDVMWYLWCGAYSPLYGKDKMTTFERYFIAETATHKENRDPYFTVRNKPEVCVRILENFGLTDDSACIVNGHVPVEIKKGESPIKADGKLLNIDGGFAKAYQKVTGIAGYTLTYNSNGMALTGHKPFNTADEIIYGDSLEFVPRKYVSYNEKRIKVADTDSGKAILEKIDSLQMLVKAYTDGTVKERS
jgi:fructose-1,6-bisphosphatase-3